MGVPRLAAVLEPFAHTKSLDNESLVIDGPGLAYHMHQLSRRKINYPSYEALGKTAIEWLDSLIERHVTVYVGMRFS